ncbi:hypothetical protein ACMGD3_08460 [Lysinibacillus sphaericus]|uniref:hypothetical protein n=1 Tax=Lysinibacillus sphaericus TaxID=1421 RepID=UPI003F7934F8
MYPIRTTEEGRRQYKANSLQCASCPLLAPCTTSKDHRNIIERPIWAHYVDYQSDMKQIYARRKETIERI